LDASSSPPGKAARAPGLRFEAALTARFLAEAGGPGGRRPGPARAVANPSGLDAEHLLEPTVTASASSTATAFAGYT